MHHLMSFLCRQLSFRTIFHHPIKKFCQRRNYKKREEKTFPPRGLPCKKTTHVFQSSKRVRNPSLVIDSWPPIQSSISKNSLNARSKAIRLRWPSQQTEWTLLSGSHPNTRSSRQKQILKNYQRSQAKDSEQNLKLQFLLDIQSKYRKLEW